VVALAVLLNEAPIYVLYLHSMYRDGVVPLLGICAYGTLVTVSSRRTQRKVGSLTKHQQVPQDRGHHSLNLLLHVITFSVVFNTCVPTAQQSLTRCCRVK
jgi:hypothetical protein